MAIFTTLLLVWAEAKPQASVFCGIVGIICTFFPVLYLRKQKKHKQEPTEITTSDEKPISTKRSDISWFDYAWRTILLIVATFLILLSIFSFLTDKGRISFGIGYLVIGLLLLLPFVWKKFKGGLKSYIHSKRLSWRARIRMFDEVMLMDSQIMIEDKIHTCLNCGYDYKGWYCPNCGQDRRNDNIDWHQLFLGMVSEAINFDGSTLRTIYELIRRPGVALHSYLEGHHERYSNPIKFVFFSGALFTILSIVLLQPIQTSESTTRLSTVFNELADNITVYQCIMAFFVDFFPLYWTFKWTKEGRKFKQVDFYIIMLYLIGMDFWTRAFFCVPMVWIDHKTCNAIRWSLMFCYQFYVLKDFFQLRFWQTFGLYVVRYILYLGFVCITLIPFLILESIGNSQTGSFPVTEKVANTITGDVIGSFWHYIFSN